MGAASAVKHELPTPVDKKSLAKAFRCARLDSTTLESCTATYIACDGGRRLRVWGEIFAAVVGHRAPKTVLDFFKPKAAAGTGASAPLQDSSNSGRMPASCLAGKQKLGQRPGGMVGWLAGGPPSSKRQRSAEAPAAAPLANGAAKAQQVRLTG